MGARIRVLVVDDSVVIRRLVTQALEESPEIEVVGTAANGRIALQRIPQLNPDAVTMDVEMPEMNGIEAVREIRKCYPKLRVIMFSTLTQRGASATIEALACGADDYVTKASNVGSLGKSMASLRAELAPKIKQFFSVPAARPRIARPPGAVAVFRGTPAPRGSTQRKALVVGVSTGGPQALSAFLPRIPGDFPAPVLIVQHMPAMFTRLLAERLQTQSKLRVTEAADGDVVEPGRAFIAPGDFHMRPVKRDGRIVLALDKGPPENSCRPSVDPMFRAAAEIWGAGVVAAVLTGMGQDGLRGAESLKGRGAYVIAQDEESSVVWGMPGAVVNAGHADVVASLDSMAAAVQSQFNR